VHLTIKDTGRGIPPEAQQHVFEEFYQVDNPGHDRSRGLGLGLAITKRLVDLLALRLTMQSAVGVGTAFTLQLPRGAAAIAVARVAAPPVEIERTRVLVVDDALEIREAMRLLLEDLGCRVQLAESTAEALQRAEQMRPDVVVTDLRLRGTDNGLETIRRLRALYSGLPAVLVTGDSTAERLRDSLDSGIKLLHKPVRPDTLAAAIQELTGARHAGQAQEKRQQSGI
jgi:CheY-like chemotaxis protein